MHDSDCPLRKAVDDDNRLRVHLVPMASGDNPWRTRGEYEDDQCQNRWQFRMTIITLIVSIVSTSATAIIAVYTMISYTP